MLAWLRRIIVSLGIGGASYLIMLAFMILSVVYDKELEPITTFAFETGRRVVDVLDSWVAGNYWGQVAVNHLRERVNMTHVILSIPAIIIAVIFIGIPLNRVLGGTKSALQRTAIALISIPATVVLAVGLFTFNALVPEMYGSLLRFADWIWQGSLNALNNSGDTIPGARALANLAKQGFSGHHYVIMALCSSLAAFPVNAFFSFGRHSKEHSPPTRIEVASAPESYKAALRSSSEDSNSGAGGSGRQAALQDRGQAETKSLNDKRLLDALGGPLENPSDTRNVLRARALLSRALIRIVKSLL